MTNEWAPNRVDSLVDVTAALLFAALVGLACYTVAGLIPGSLGATGGFAVGALLMRRVASGRPSQSSFVPEAFADVLDEADELLLDDPLVRPDSGSRVVKLFAGAESSPGALVARIEDYLGRDGDPVVRPRPVGEGPSHQADASAALHAALSNIRASLR